MNNLQKALKTKYASTAQRGLRMANGGAVSGPGTGTSDDIDVSLSNGEYVLPADTVAQVGVPALNQLKDATHAPTGLRQPMGYADGGLIEEDPLRAERLRSMTGQRPAIPPVDLEAGERLRAQTGLRAAVPPSTPVGPDLAQGERLRAAPNLRGTGLPQPQYPQPQAAAPSAAPAAPAPLPTAAAAEPAGLAERAGRAAGNGLRMIGPAARFIGATAPLTGFGDYKIKDDIDSSAGGTAGYLAGGEFGKVGRSLSKGALEAGLDSVSGLAKTADGLGSLVGQNFGLRQRFDGAVQDKLGGVLQQPAAQPTLRQPTTDPAANARATSLAQAADKVAPTGGDPNSIGRVPANVAAFQQQYSGAATRAAERLGVDPNMLLAQWGMETGWGKSVIPGTNNLGNIKDFSGAPTSIRATDNATGSRDKYAQFASPEDFADSYAGLMERKYQGVKGAKDIGAFASGLVGGENRYAEDPAYASKLASSYSMLNGQGFKPQPGAAPVPSLRSPAAKAGPDTPLDKDGNVKDGWVHIIRGLEQTYQKPGAGTDEFYSDGSPTRSTGLRSLISARNAGIDPRDQVASDRVGVDALEAKARIDSNNLTRQINDENKDADRALKAGAAVEAKAKTSWEEFRRDAAEAHTTAGPDGKPLVDYNAVQQQEAGMKRGLATLGVASPGDLTLENRERLKVAIDLGQKINAIASNLNPLKPNPISSDDPTDLFGLERLPNGDALTRKGEVIPKRVIDKVDSDFFLGKPTNKFAPLFKKENKDGLR